MQAHIKQELRHILILLLTIGLIASACILGVLFYLAQRIDVTTNHNTRSNLSVSLSEWQDTVSMGVEDSAYWTLAYDLVRNGDAEGLYEHVGSSATESDIFDWMVILSTDGRLLHAYGLTALDAETVAASEEVNILREWLKGDAPRDYISHSAYVQWSDQIGTATAAWITPDGVTTGQSDNLPIMIGGKTLNSTAMARLVRRSGAQNLALVSTPEAAPDNRFSLAGPQGTIGWLTWVSPRPGMAMALAALPWLSMVCIALFTAAVLVAMRVRRMVRDITGVRAAKEPPAQDDGLFSRAFYLGPREEFCQAFEGSAPGQPS